MAKYYYIDFSGSLLMEVPEEENTDRNNLLYKFFDYLNSLNATHVHQFQYVEVDGLEESTNS